MSGKSAKRDQKLGIGAVAKLTGLSDHTIRVWERRYGAVIAERASNGRRLYSAADVEKLSLLRVLTSGGLSIGRIAGESVEQLAARAAEVRKLAAAPVTDTINTAILGDFLPPKLASGDIDLGPLRIVAADSSEQRFTADVEQQPVDVLVIETPALGADTMQRLDGLMKASGAVRAVCLYSFGKTADINRLQDRGVTLLRAPVSIGEAVAGVVRAYREADQPGVGRSLPGAAAADEGDDSAHATEPRLFNQQQLARLANTSSTIDCECPQHLAQLVGDLSAFEIYSANCANRDEDDAALHRYLHRTTARARAMIERALDKVAQAEGLL